MQKKRQVHGMQREEPRTKSSEVKIGGDMETWRYLFLVWREKRTGVAAYGNLANHVSISTSVGPGLA